MIDVLTIHRWLLAHQIHHEIVRLPTPVTGTDGLPDALGLPPIRCIAVHVFESGPPAKRGGPIEIGGPIKSEGPIKIETGDPETGDALETVTPGPGNGLVAVMTAAGSPPDAEVIKWLLRSRTAGPASAMRINIEAGYRCGLVCPLLLPETMSVLIDQRLADRLPADEVVYTATGENHTALGIRAFDLLSLANAKPVDLRPEVIRVPGYAYGVPQPRTAGGNPRGHPDESARHTQR